MLTQIIEKDKFVEVRAECNKLIKENRVRISEIGEDINKSLGLMTMDNATAKIYKDQDGGEHLVFITAGEELDKEFFSDFYNNIYGTGEQCNDTSNLVYQKKCLRFSCIDKGFEEAEVSVMTVISIIKLCHYGNNLGLMSFFLHWLYSVTE